MRAQNLLLSAVAACLVVAPALAQPGGPAAPNCVKPPGFFAGPFVPNETVAKEIYRAVAHAIVPANEARFPVIVAMDGGDHWIVTQTDGRPAEVKGPNGQVTITMGGGQLSMYVDKCSGAISHAALNR